MTREWRVSTSDEGEEEENNVGNAAACLTLTPTAFIVAGMLQAPLLALLLKPCPLVLLLIFAE